jgi:hypothetical protein
MTNRPWEQETGLPYSLTPAMSQDERDRYKVIRRDTFEEITDMILSAYTETGNCMFRGKDGAPDERQFGADGIRIVRR